MIKRISAVATALLMLITLAACNKGAAGTSSSFDSEVKLAATVYGEDITVAAVNAEVENSRLSYESALKQIDALDNETDRKTALEMLSKPKTYDEVLNDRIKRIVLLHEAEAQKLTADYEECKKQAEKNYNDLKAIPESDKENYQAYLIVKNYIEENNLTEEEYIEKSAEQFYQSAKIGALRSKFYEEQYEINNITKEEQFESYAEELVKKAKVKYYK